MAHRHQQKTTPERGGSGRENTVASSGTEAYTRDVRTVEPRNSGTRKRRRTVRNGRAENVQAVSGRRSRAPGWRPMGKQHMMRTAAKHAMHDGGASLRGALSARGDDSGAAETSSWWPGHTTDHQQADRTGGVILWRYGSTTPVSSSRDDRKHRRQRQFRLPSRPRCRVRTKANDHRTRHIWQTTPHAGAVADPFSLPVRTTTPRDMARSDDRALITEQHDPRSEPCQHHFRLSSDVAERIGRATGLFIPRYTSLCDPVPLPRTRPSTGRIQPDGLQHRITDSTL